jgi:predicted nucleic acid-binding protein
MMCFIVKHCMLWRHYDSKNARLVTTEFVLLEVADALSAPSIRSQTIGFIDGLRQLPILQIVPASQVLFTVGWTFYGQRSDKDWGLTDCTSFVVMVEEQITQAFTSDHHFEQAGFANLLFLSR